MSKKKAIFIIGTLLIITIVAYTNIDTNDYEKITKKSPRVEQKQEEKPISVKTLNPLVIYKPIPTILGIPVSASKSKAKAQVSKEKNSTKIKDDFSNVIFIGDSITYGFINAQNTPISKENIYAKVGGHVFEGSKFLGNDKELIIKRCKGSVDYVFIMFGANDYGYEKHSYELWYKQLIHHVKEIFPNSKIVIQSVMPMNNSNSQPNRSEEPAKLNIINQAIAVDENIQYLNISGNIPNLKQLHVSDGLHFKAQLYPLWINVIKNNII